VILGYVGLGVKFALRRRRAAIFTILSIAISVSLLLSSFSIGTSIRMSTNEYIQDTTSPIDITISSTKWGSPISADMMSRISQNEHVENIIPRIEETAQVQNGSNWLHFLLIGIDLVRESNIGSFTVSNGTANINESSCFMSDTAIQLANLSIGHTIQLYTSAGIHFFEIVGSGNALDKGVIGPAVFISIDSAWDIYGIRYPNNSSNTLLVEVDNTFAIPSVVDGFSSLLGPDFIVTNQKSYNLWFVSLFLAQTDLILGVLILGAIFVAALRVFSSYSLIFSERKFETGLMRAFGASNLKIVLVLLSEIGVVGFTGAILGIITGVATSSIVSQIVNSVLVVQNPLQADLFFQPTIVLNPGLFFLAGFMGLLLTIFAGSIPAFTATRNPVTESLRNAHSGVASPASIPSRYSKLTKRVLQLSGVLLTSLVVIQISSDFLHLSLIRNDWVRAIVIPALILLVAGFSDRLARPSSLVNAIKSRTKPVIRKMFSTSLKRRSTSALLVFNLFVAVVVILLFSSNVTYSITNSWENTLGWQSSSTNIVAYLDESVSSNAIGQIRDQQNISGFTELASVYQLLNHQNTVDIGLIFGIEPQTFENLASVGIIETQDPSLGLSIINQASNSCVISKHASNVFGVTLGQQIEVDDRVNLTVVAICESSVPIFLFTFISPVFIFVNYDTWVSVAEEPFKADGVLLDSQTPEITVSNLSEIIGVNPVLISTVLHDYSQALDSFRLTLDISIGFVLTTVIISAILSGWSAATARRREIGMLRALGMKGNEVSKILTLESTVPMIAGVLVGTIIGILTNLSLADIILRLSGGQFTLVDYRTLLITAGSLIISIIASYYASLKTTRAPTNDLLSDRQRTS
ncbi:MAG: ABC transporter permease, partial [Candidatus Thorarchaeota archaeon]